jgi:hypothetical protein
VIHLLQNEVWDGKDLQDHIDHMSSLHSQCVEYGTANTDDYKYECLTNSILRCSSCPKPFRDVITHFSISPTLYTYAQLLESLQTKASVVRLEQQKNAQRNKSEKSTDRANSAKKGDNNSNKRTNNEVYEEEVRVNSGSTNYSTPKKGQASAICDHCKKPGHTKEQCWQLKACEICGELGHPAWKCSQGTEDGVHTSSTSKKPKANREVQLVDNFNKKYPHKG